MPPEQSLAHITHHIIAKSAARRDQAAQVFGLVGDLVGTLVAVEQGFVGGKATRCTRIISLVKKNAYLGEKGLDIISPIW